MAPENGESSVDLFTQDHTRELVWKSDAAEREEKIGALATVLRPPVGRADRKDETLCADVSKSTKALSEALRGKQFANAIQEYDLGSDARAGPIERFEECGFGGEERSLYWKEAGSASYVVCDKRIRSLRLRSRAG